MLRFPHFPGLLRNLNQALRFLMGSLRFTGPCDLCTLHKKVLLVESRCHTVYLAS
jgi:hypothetical protein